MPYCHDRVHTGRPDGAYYPRFILWAAFALVVLVGPLHVMPVPVAGGESPGLAAASAPSPAAPALAVHLADPVAYTLPPAIPFDRAAAQLARLTARDGGATYSLYFGNQARAPLYAVAIFPEFSQRTPGKLQEPVALRQFIERYRSLLADPRCCVGTRFDGTHSWVEILAVVPDRALALRLGRRADQLAILDLAAGQEIAAGGSGLGPVRPSPAERRLPPLRSPAQTVAVTP